MEILTLVPAVLALALLVVTIYLVLRPNPLQSRLEELLQERSRLSASLEHATRTLDEEKSRASAQLAAEQERGRAELAAALERSRQELQAEQARLKADLATEQQRATRQLAESEQRAAGQLVESEQRAARQLAEAEERAAKHLADVEARAAKQLTDAQQRATVQLAESQERAARQLAEQKQWVTEQTQHFEQRVLAAAARLMEERSKALGELNQSEVQKVVAPFKEQLDQFRKRVDDIYAAENHERGALKTQIEQLTMMNQAMSAQAERLANALTITSKSVGDWGETILQKILEDSGLRLGHEYDLQVTVRDADDRAQRPDAVIRLPESRQLVIDSKVSNKAWTEYCAAVDDEQRALKLREHLASLRTHIKELSARRYQDLPSLDTVDFVLMFVPVEAALLTAFVKDPALYSDAYRSRIVLVTPSTLMAVVKLVEGIWTFQKRKESADEIAEAGRKLYEKISNFAHSFVSIGRALQQSRTVYDQAEAQLTGKGSALRLAERLRDLGVTPAHGKQIPQVLLELSEDDQAT